MLDELANFGVYEKLDEKIDEYLRPENLFDFYQVLLTNYEADFGEPLVRRFLSLIAVSKNGLSEWEIMKITGLEKRPILWSQFYCSFRQQLIVINGLISFSNEPIREAVEGRYFGGTRDSIKLNWRDSPQYDWDRSCRKDIVAALEGEMTTEGRKTLRSMDEVPYQLSILNDLTKLHDYLMDLDAFSYLYENEETNLDYYWWKLINKGNYSLEEYLAGAEQYGERQWAVLLNEVGSFSKLYLGLQKTREYLIKVLDVRRKIAGEKHTDVAIAYNNIGAIYGDLGNHKKALEHQEKALQIRLSIFGERHPDVANSYINIGYEYRELGDLEKEVEFLSKALEIARAIKDESLELKLHNRLGKTYEKMGIKDKAREENRLAAEMFKAMGRDVESAQN